MRAVFSVARRMTDPDWMYERDDLGLQQKRGKNVDWQPIKRLATIQSAERIAEEAGKLLSLAYTATRYILAKSKSFAEANGKQLMVLLLDPSGAMGQLF